MKKGKEDKKMQNHHDTKTHKSTKKILGCQVREGRKQEHKKQKKIV